VIQSPPLSAYTKSPKAVKGLTDGRAKEFYSACMY